MKLKDEEIVELMSHSSEKGIKAMMEAYQSRLYWHIRRLVADHHAAQDILQDAFIKAYRNFGQFKKDSKLYTWLYRIATNEALQQLAKAKKMQKSDEETAQRFMENLAADEAESDAEEILVLLQKAIQTLPEKQKAVFSMRYYDEAAYEDIGEALDMSVGTCKTNYHYAKEKIEKYIIEHGEN